MARPLRIEFAGAVYHITARGNARQDVFLGDDDRESFLELLSRVCDRYQWFCHAYCLMTNHYHLLIETQNSTLSKGMKHLNGTYTQAFNRRHQRIGHVFQGRFKSILVDKDSYLLELSRYIVLNPVRAGMVRSARDWRWSSYRATAGQSAAVSGLTTDWILGHFSQHRGRAQRAYRDFVKQGKNQPSPWKSVKNQIYLGSEEFIDTVQAKLNPEQSLDDIPKAQKLKPVMPLEYYLSHYADRKLAMAEAYLSGHYTLAQVGAVFGVSYATVSRAVKARENDK